MSTIPIPCMLTFIDIRVCYLVHFRECYFVQRAATAANANKVVSAKLLNCSKMVSQSCLLDEMGQISQSTNQFFLVPWHGQGISTSILFSCMQCMDPEGGWRALRMLNGKSIGKSSGALVVDVSHDVSLQ